jgi:hypothetical protein
MRSTMPNRDHNVIIIKLCLHLDPSTLIMKDKYYSFLGKDHTCLYGGTLMIN